MRLPLKVYRKQFFFLAGIFIIIILINTFISFSESFWNPKHINYFSEDLSFDEYHGFIVNTSHCKILNLSAWDPSILQFLHPYMMTDCYKTHKHWTYVQGTNLVLNITSIEESGYTFNSLYCCYRVITRVEQSLDNYDENADAISKISDKCEQLTQEITSLTVEFIRVKCTSKYWPLYSDIVYRKSRTTNMGRYLNAKKVLTRKLLEQVTKNSRISNFIGSNFLNYSKALSQSPSSGNHHTLAQPFKSSRTIEKIKFWGPNKYANSTTNTTTIERPPNVLIIGIDSVSRLNFQRTMKKTRQYLFDIGSIEMAGYTKVGENTLPNVQSFLSGYSEQDLNKICYFSTETPQDACPYIWKRFDQANYLTAHLEDSPGLNAFNRLKTGFVNVQVDYYLRPFMLDIFGPIFAKGTHYIVIYFYEHLKSRTKCGENLTFPG